MQYFIVHGNLYGYTFDDDIYPPICILTLLWGNDEEPLFLELRAEVSKGSYIRVDFPDGMDDMPVSLVEIRLLPSMSAACEELLKDADRKDEDVQRLRGLVRRLLNYSTNL